MPTECLIYCRVSSRKQVDEGTGLDSQEKRCRNFAKEKKYRVTKVFRDEGVSGSLFDRPAMQEMINFIDENNHKNFAVVFDDLSRFARDIQVHIKLKIELVQLRNVKLECLNFSFEDSIESELSEMVTAAVNQYHRKQNSRQVKQKQKARLENGYWPFCPPRGFRHIKDKEHGKVLIPREPYASIYKEAFEGYASDLLLSEHDVQRFISKKYKEHGISGSISHHGTHDTLTKLLYTGYVEYPLWQVPRFKAQHKGFISLELFERVQDKLAGRTKKKLRRDFSLDFPLRGFTVCDSCGGLLRGSWNSGRSKSYANYACTGDGCKYKHKSTRADVIHPQFEALLTQVEVPKEVLELTKAIFSDVWETKSRDHQNEKMEKEKQLREVDESINVFLERISKTSNQTLIQTYEEKIEKLSDEKKEFTNKKRVVYDKNIFEKSLNRVNQVLENPLDLWNSDNYEDKRTVLYMYFNGKLRFDYKEGLRTAYYSEPIKLFSSFGTEKVPHVEMRGYEPLSV